MRVDELFTQTVEGPIVNMTSDTKLSEDPLKCLKIARAEIFTVRDTAHIAAEESEHSRSADFGVIANLSPPPLVIRG